MMNNAKANDASAKHNKPWETIYSKSNPCTAHQEPKITKHEQPTQTLFISLGKSHPGENHTATKQPQGIVIGNKQGATSGESKVNNQTQAEDHLPEHRWGQR